MLGFLEKLTAEPDALDADDVAALHEVGISDEAIEDAVLICSLFHVITRVADALEFEIPRDKFARMAPIMLRRGYL